ncbi:unnamed protein product, partial [marine sediment metagenome]
TIRNDGVPFTKDELYGGYLLLHHATNMQNRRILGNTPNTGAGDNVGAIASAVAAVEAAEGVEAAPGYFTVTADVHDFFKKGDKIVVYDSDTANDNFYTVKIDATFDSPTTTITVEEAVVAADAGGFITGAVTIFLEEPITNGFAVASFLEILPNPYADLQGALLANERVSHAGIPGTEAALGEYFWVQTWGPCWIIPGGGSPEGVGIVANDRTVVFVGDGSINAVTNANVNLGYQVAGFIIQNDSSGVGGPPLVMLQIRPLMRKAFRGCAGNSPFRLL